MKKILLMLAAVFSLLTACKEHQPVTTEEIANDKIYLFYANTCPHCHDALKYLNQNHPVLPVTMVNVANRHGYELFIKCARKFNLGRQIGTPLFCIGNHYLMGWSPNKALEFDRLVKQFSPQG